MEPQQTKVDLYEKFTWKIENFSCLKNIKKLYSEPFVLSGYPWRISLFPQGNKQVDYLSVYLEAVETANMSEGWSRHAKLRLAVYNQFDSKRTITTKDTFHKFNKKENDWGYKNLLPLLELNDPQKGFLVKDVCIIGAEVFVLKAINEKQVSQATGLTASFALGGQTGLTQLEVPKQELESQSPILETLSPVAGPTIHTDVELFSDSIGELIDFRGLGQIEKAFVPLLEEVCSHHSSLIECQKNRSRKFAGWAFSALGRVLYFLKTKKVKDMNDLACESLQTLWEELVTFGFDLTWLEPHVQSTLGMKNYVEKVMQVEKLTENMTALELEIERLKAKFVAAEVNLDAERDLLKGKGFQVRDLDAELGYGGWEAKSI